MIRYTLMLLSTFKVVSYYKGVKHGELSYMAGIKYHVNQLLMKDWLAKLLQQFQVASNLSCIFCYRS